MSINCIVLNQLIELNKKGSGVTVVPGSSM